MAGSLRDQIEQEEPLSEAPPSEIGFFVPKWLRVMGALVLGGVLFLASCLLVAYFLNREPAWEPAKLDIIDLMVFCFVGLIVCLLPWEHYRLRLRKIGPLEFEQILSTQAEERDAGFHEIRQRLATIEASHSSRIKEKNELANDDLTRLVKSLLAAHKVAFSPARIAAWGGHQPGFEKLSNYSRDEIRRVLQGMVAKKELETVVSKRGNTLYRLPQHDRAGL